MQLSRNPVLNFDLVLSFFYTKKCIFNRCLIRSYTTPHWHPTSFKHIGFLGRGHVCIALVDTCVLFPMKRSCFDSLFSAKCCRYESEFKTWFLVSCIYLAIKPDVAFDWHVWHTLDIYSTIFSLTLNSRCCAKHKNSHDMYSFRLGFGKFVVQAILSRHLVGGLLSQTGAKPGVTLQPNGEAKCDFKAQGQSQG